MLKLIGGRLYQWDLGRQMELHDPDGMQITEVNFCHSGDDEALVVIPERNGDTVTVDIPDVLMQSGEDLMVYECIGDVTVSRVRKSVIPRERPADYIYTETQVLTYKTLEERIAKLEQGGAVSDDKLAAAIAAYLEEHPIDAGLDEAELAAYLTENGYLTSADLADAIAQALADAKASGEFDGAPGKDGTDGGYYTPNVDNDGNLTWTPSADNMPAVTGANIKGPRGEAGPAGVDGAQGPAGADGQPGADGVTPNIQIGTVETLASGSDATASITGTAENPLLNLGIPKGADGVNGKSAYQYARDGGYTGTEADFAAKLAAEKFANPNALIFTGAVTGAYDGSEPMTVNVPSGGSGSGAEKTWSLLLDETLSEDTAYIFQDLSAPVTELIIEFIAGGDGTHRDVTIFNRQGVGYGKNIATFKNVLRSDTNVTARFVIHCVAFPGLAFFRCQYNNYNNSVGDNVINASSALLFGDEPGPFNGSANFDCISIGCWSGGNSGVFKAGTRVKVYGKI